MLLVLTALVNVFGSSVNGSNKDHVQWWLYTYGDYAKAKGKNDPRVTWALDVFERVKGAADKAEARVPRLFFIDARGGPYALAVPDGGIIIHPRTLDICYKGVPRSEGDRRLAFILGHELAHLSNKDFIHREAFLALKKNGQIKKTGELIRYFKQSRPEKLKTAKKRELLADQKGALYAGMAGYDISKLFREQDSFLKDWANQTGAGYHRDDPRHPAMKKRERFVRSQLKAVAKQVELFRAGVLLYQAGSYHDGASAFVRFSRAYPAREVFNNIGACYFSLALRQLYLKYHPHYFRFKLSTAIDFYTTAEKMNLRAGDDYLADKDIAGYIQKAEDYFRRAAARDKQDRTCRYNLAAALILKKEYARAQAECDALLKTNPDDVNALNNKAVAFYYYGKEEGLDTTQKAIQALEKALRLEPGNAEVLYNLASLKQERKRTAGARRYWEKYIALPNNQRDGFYKYAYKKLRGKTLAADRKKTAAPPMPPNVRPGDDFTLIEKKWGNGRTSAYKLAIEENTDPGSVFVSMEVLVKGNVRILALEGTVEIVEREARARGPIDKILKRYGPPRRVARHTGGNFYVYTDRGFSIKEVGGFVYSYTWFEKEF